MLSVLWRCRSCVISISVVNSDVNIKYQVSCRRAGLVWAQLSSISPSCTIRALRVFASVFAYKLAAANLGLNLVDSKLGHNWLPDNCRFERTIQQIL